MRKIAEFILGWAIISIPYYFIQTRWVKANWLFIFVYVVYLIIMGSFGWWLAGRHSKYYDYYQD